jgi:hypothetical protein
MKMKLFMLAMIVSLGLLGFRYITFGQPRLMDNPEYYFDGPVKIRNLDPVKWVFLNMVFQSRPGFGILISLYI